jgi:hypothetical protein
MFITQNLLYVGSFFGTGMLAAWDISGNTWTTKTSHSTEAIYRGHSTSGEVRYGQAYFRIGWEGVMQYNIATDTWTQPYLFTGYWGASFFIGDKIFFGLGESSFGALSSYNTATGIVENYWNCPEPVTSQVSISIGSKGYVFSNSGKEMWVFDPSQN